MLSTNFCWNSQAAWMYEAILYIAVAYILLCKLNQGYHNQACLLLISSKWNTFQLWNLP